MEEWQQRVVEEKEELDEKLQKLAAFLVGATSRALPQTSLDLLLRQQRAMTDYSSVLGQRIAAF